MDKAVDGLQAVLTAEERRRQALLMADLEALQGMLADDLRYVHSTAASDSKDSYLAKLRSGGLRYQALQFDDLQARLLGPLGDVAVVTGRMAAQVLKDGQVRAVRSLFMTVWARSADTVNWQLRAHQGTPLQA